MVKAALAVGGEEESCVLYRSLKNVQVSIDHAKLYLVDFVQGGEPIAHNNVYRDWPGLGLVLDAELALCLTPMHQYRCSPGGMEFYIR